MRTPFPLFFVEKRGDTGSLTKKAGRNIPGSMGNALHFRQTGYDLSATSYATVRHDLLYFLRSERQTRGREAGARSTSISASTYTRWATTSDRIMRLPYSYSPSCATVS